MKLHHLLLTAALAGGLAHIALGQDATPPAGGPPAGGPGGPGGQRGNFDPAAAFKKLDADGDGKVSKDEYLKSPRAAQDPAKAGERFAKIDKDGDGFLTLDEFKAGRPVGPRGGQGGPGGPGKGPGGEGKGPGTPPPPAGGDKPKTE